MLFLCSAILTIYLPFFYHDKTFPLTSSFNFFFCLSLCYLFCFGLPFLVVVVVLEYSHIFSSQPWRISAEEELL